MKLELSFPVIFKMPVTGFILAQKVNMVELFFSNNVSFSSCYLCILSSVNSIQVSKIENILL